MKRLQRCGKFVQATYDCVEIVRFMFGDEQRRTTFLFSELMRGFKLHRQNVCVGLRSVIAPACAFLDALLESFA